MDKKVTIATHDGMFHADDVFAVASLLILLDKAPVVANIRRTRDEGIITNADFVVDVGGFYEPERNRFDHHQEAAAGQRPNGVSYASFGLVWQKFGLTIAGSSEVAAAVDRDLVTPIDANDTGLEIFKKTFPDVVPYCLEDYVHNLRPTWLENSVSLDTRFLEAVSFARKVLERQIAHAAAAAAAAALVRRAYEEATDKRVIVLYKEYPCEKTLAAFPEPLFAVSPRADGNWHLKAIRDDYSTFKNRLDLPASWAGKRDGELAAITGVPDAVFCHANRFMAVARSKEGAVALAKLALQI